ncbi:glycerol-3-phosphate dehydrogenase [Halovenus aranensis]|uniref:Glycerol-3-phosphate dehydrogenase n=1 Tax=Halovenus aranensis TaxID=890420 RepID=A0A1G8RRQ6_9EURY|nr:FAD-dependent oxidoreductase [Halovenus aranensis]SDJ19648.1 glycerol-3-phosphate dehydrogenase [Halovenus aranensis]
MSVEPTVLVIGGGATGTGIARDLALRDVDVMLVERGGLGSGTTGRSHGLLHSGARYADSDAQGASDCLAESQTLRGIAGECIRETGGLFVRLDSDDPEYFDAKRRACEKIGIQTDRLDGDTARERIPGLADSVAEAFRVPDGVIFPSRLVAANAADAAAHGGTICPQTPVAEIDVGAGGVETVHLGGAAEKSVTPDCVINAAGAWAGEIAGMAGVTVGMAPSRGVMVSLEYDRLDPVLNRCREPSDGDILVPHNGAVVAGTTSVPVSTPDDYETAEWEVEQTIEECAAMVPAVAEATERRRWWGVRPLYAPDETGTDRRGISRGFTVLDHGEDGVSNFYSVVGGKLTTYRKMAAVTSDRVCEYLGVDEPCTTGEKQLRGADDPERLDAFVDRYGGPNPTDTDVHGTSD